MRHKTELAANATKAIKVYKAIENLDKNADKLDITELLSRFFETKFMSKPLYYSHLLYVG